MARKDHPVREYEQGPTPPLALRSDPGPSGENPRRGNRASSDDMEGTERTGPPRSLLMLGLILLIATAVGAGWALNSSLFSEGGSPTQPRAVSGPPGVVALGYVFSDPDIVNLHPTQPGRVVDGMSEGASVKKGAVLLRLDNELARLNVKAAQAALDDARDQLAKAKNNPAKHAIDMQLQKDAISAAGFKLEALKREWEIKKQLAKKVLIGQQEVDIYEENVKAMQKLVAVEQGKLEALQLVQPELEVARARHDVEAKEVLLEKAKLALKECDLLAPSDGTVLRVFANPGEVVGSQSKAPAIQFCPTGRRIIRAEVLQEWASMVKKGQKVTIQDDTESLGRGWTGTVRHVSDWFTQRRLIVPEPMVFNDVRTLECVIDVHAGGPPLRIGQRVRVIIPQN